MAKMVVKFRVGSFNRTHVKNRGEIRFVKIEVFKSANHVTSLLAGYGENALATHEAQRVKAHLQQCARCRQTHEALNRAVSALADTPCAPAPDGLWLRVETVIAAQNPVERVGATPRLQPMKAGRIKIAVTALLLLLVSSGVWHRQAMRTQANEHRSIPLPGASWKVEIWKVESLAGVPLVQNTGVRSGTRFGVGESLTTDARSRARIQAADIGQVDVAPNSRLRLVQAQTTRHQLSLEQGELSARIVAPPRLFLVQTPSTLAIDLGCAYTLRVDKAGDSRLCVTEGHVALAGKGRETEVPAGAVCLTHKGAGTGTPFFADAPPALQAALEQVDFGQGGDEALNVILLTARPRDTLTLWNLLPRVTEAQRRHVIDCLLTYVTLPSGVTRDGIQKLNVRMLAQWKAQMELFWVALP